MGEDAAHRTLPFTGLGVAGGCKELFRDPEFVGHPAHDSNL